MLDHVGFAVSDAEASRQFYAATLAPLGITLLMTVPAQENGSGGTAHGFGRGDDPFFWIGDNERVGEGTHIAFRAGTRAEVDAFHAAALAAGGRDHGAPGLRPLYHPNYYAAFVRDPDGLNIEAVCHAPG
ncbi:MULTISPECIES: VOC family protein [unclassified Sphingomonas]|uniref:VOC family protein n=1 Tax=Sphingomonas TaxID=13687 RepID=UPI000960687C|nr:MULTISPECIES: VOC family protein [unclassified Sphingomonas]MBN8810671.1 VOC family protein [Sphingomonas sp.]OJY49415.1 MAG: glyoxalase [Sphingomonas sp. 67-41]